MRRILLTSGVLFVAVSLFGCGKAPEPLIQQAVRATPESTVTEMRGSSLPTESELSQISTPSPALQYNKPEAQTAVEDYTNKWQQLQTDKQTGISLGLVDPLTNPGAITSYVNKIGMDANQLYQAEHAARGLMNPQEKKRFKAYQKELTQPVDE